MTRMIPESHPLHRLFRGLTEIHVHGRARHRRPALVGYVADLLARFVPSPKIWRLRDAQGRRLTEVAEMVAEAEATPDDERRRECHRHVGDFTLFWTGVYPEALAQLQVASRRPPHRLSRPRASGRTTWPAPSTARGARPPRLSDEFELCAFGLSRVRREWERHEPESPSGPNRGVIGT